MARKHKLNDIGNYGEKIPLINNFNYLADEIDNVEVYLKQYVNLRNPTFPSVPSSFVIAPADAVNKERADLVLTGNPEADRAAIQEAIDDLHNKRESTDVAIRIDFMGGNIDLGTVTDGSAIIIPLGYDNIHLYGNGVKLTGEVYDSDYVETYSVFTNNADNVIIDGFNIVNNTSGYGYGLSNSGNNCTITGNTCDSEYDGLSNSGNNCTIIGNTCSSDYGDGLSNTGNNCTISENTCSGNECGLSNSGTNCIISENTCSSGDYGSSLYNTSTNCTITGNICNAGVNSLHNSGTNCTITGNTCNASGHGLYNTGTNCIISENTCSGNDYAGLYNTGTNCIISENTCSSNYDGDGLYNSGTNCTITSNTCSSGYGNSLYNGSTSTTDKCIIIGNICVSSGISVKSGTCLPATQEAMADVNTGTITLRP